MIVLIRHGETEGNRQRILQTAETLLNAQGQQQAERLARRAFCRALDEGANIAQCLARLTVDVSEVFGRFSDNTGGTSNQQP